MPYITSIERMGIERGRREGLEQGLEQGLERGILQRAQEDVLEVLRLRFPPIPRRLTARIQKVDDPAFLRELHQAAVTVASLKDFQAVLDGEPAQAEN